jgi:hypothetical protein
MEMYNTFQCVNGTRETLEQTFSLWTQRPIQRELYTSTAELLESGRYADLEGL